MSDVLIPELAEAEGRLAERNKKLHDVFDEGTRPGEGGKSELDLDRVKVLGDGLSKQEKLDAIRALKAEIDDLGEKVAELRPIGEAAKMAAEMNGDHFGGGLGLPGDDRSKGKGPVTFGAAFTKSHAFGRGGKGKQADLDVDLKTLFQTSAGWAPETTRSGLVVPDAQRPLQITDLLPSIPTSQAAYVYMEETTFTNNAAERAEGGAYAESALALTEQSVTIRSIGTFLPITDEQMEDVPGAMAYVDSRLPFMVRQRFDSQLLNGNDVAPNIAGILNVSGIQTQALGADSVPDACYKARTKVRVTGRAMPNAYVLHPNDWQDVRLLTTTDGIYLWGPPSDAGPARMWGLPVVESDAIAEGTGLVGDFANFSLLVIRRGMEVLVSNSHSDYFTNGKQAVRAGIRAAAVWTRPAAFCTITGI